MQKAIIPHDENNKRERTYATAREAYSEVYEEFKAALGEVFAQAFDDAFKEARDDAKREAERIRKLQEK
jgi:hypothetical protein